MTNAAATKAVALPGQHIHRITLPTSWERTYVCVGQARFIAGWWKPNSNEPSEAMVSDGRRCAATPGWPYFVDLAGLLIRNGYAQERLRYYEDPPTHCVLHDLTERTAYRATPADPLTWLRKNADLGDSNLTSTRCDLPGVIANVEHQARLRNHKAHLYSVCGGYGWSRVPDNAQTLRGYKMCDVCSGRGTISQKGEAMSYSKPCSLGNSSEQREVQTARGGTI